MGDEADAMDGWEMSSLGYHGEGEPRPDHHPHYIKTVRVIPCPSCDRMFSTPFALAQHRAAKGH